MWCVCVITIETFPTISYADWYNIRALFDTIFAAGFHHAIVRAVAPACFMPPFPHVSNMSALCLFDLVLQHPWGKGQSDFCHCGSTSRATSTALGLDWVYHVSSVPAPPFYPLSSWLGSHTGCRVTSLIRHSYRICLKITLSNPNELQTSVSYLFRSHLRKRFNLPKRKPPKKRSARLLMEPKGPY